MARKIITLALLCVTFSRPYQAKDYECTRLSEGLPNCQDNSKIVVSKTQKNYQVRLCENDRCIPHRKANLIKCKDICDACNSLHAGSNQGKTVV